GLPVILSQEPRSRGPRNLAADDSLTLAPVLRFLPRTHNPATALKGGGLPVLTAATTAAVILHTRREWQVCDRRRVEEFRWGRRELQAFAGLHGSESRLGWC